MKPKELLITFYQMLGMSREESVLQSELFENLCYTEALKIGLEQIQDRSLVDSIKQKIASNNLTNEEAIVFVKSNLDIATYKKILTEVTSRRLKSTISVLDVNLSNDQLATLKSVVLSL